MSTEITLSVQQACALLGITKQSFHANRERGMYDCIASRSTGGLQYRVYLKSLPADAQTKYWQEHEQATDTHDATVEAEIYAAAPEHSRRKADKYLQLLNMSEGLKGTELRTWINQWNMQHPENKTSYQRLIDARNGYAKHGVTHLLGKRGDTSRTHVSDDMFAYFKALYLKEGGPGIESCWRITVGWAKEHNQELQLSDVPSAMAFRRRLFKEVPEYVRFETREGKMAANRKYGFYLKRSYTDVLAGECWVSDHAQIDIACGYTKPNGQQAYGFPWVTVWRCFKSGKWLGWDLHMEPPTSDHIFSAFYRASIEHGVPRYIYIDNGKDYRCKDFSGGRRKHKLTVDEMYVRSLTGVLQIETIFAIPYNAQAKPVERDFLRNKEWLSKHAWGYRGGNVVERPESLNDEINRGHIERLEEFYSTLETFITEVTNRSVISDGHRKGMSPDELWAAEYPQACEKMLVRHVSKDAMKLFCSRTSGDMSIGRRGVHDSSLGVDYYADWMEPLKSTRRKVYLRRDPRAFQDAWVFDAVTNDFIGKAFLLQETPALVRDDVQRSVLQAGMSVKRRARKIINSYKGDGIDVSLAEAVAHQANFTEMVAQQRGAVIKEVAAKANTVLTQMDHVLAEEKRQAQRGLHDISNLVPQKDDSEDLGEIDLWARVG